MTIEHVQIGDLLQESRPGFACGESDPEGVIQVRMNNVTTDGQLDLTVQRRVPRTIKNLERFIVQSGDVLFNATNSPELVGKAALFRGHEEPVVFSNHFLRLRPQPSRLHGGYLSRWLNWFWQRGEFQRMCRQWVNQATVASDRLLGLEIPLPPLPEQQRIAAILDAAEGLREKRRQAIAKLDRLVQAVFVEMFGDPGANPKGFPRRTLGELIDFVGGSQPPRSTFTFEPGPDTIRLVQIRDFKSDEHATYIPRKLAKRFFEDDDVMIGRYGPPVFQILRGLSGSYNVALMKALPREKINRHFIFYLLKEPRLHNYVVSNSERTAGQTGVNLELLERYPAYLPPSEIQIQFAKAVERYQTLKDLQIQSLTHLDTLFISLQQRAFRGEL